jgi:cytochrome b6-f complex subunit 7
LLIGLLLGLPFSSNICTGFNLIQLYLRGTLVMGPEFYNAVILSFVLILVGLSLGFLMLKIQGGEE